MELTPRFDESATEDDHFYHWHLQPANVLHRLDHAFKQIDVPQSREGDVLDFMNYPKIIVVFLIILDLPMPSISAGIIWMDEQTSRILCSSHSPFPKLDCVLTELHIKLIELLECFGGDGAAAFCN